LASSEFNYIDEYRTKVSTQGEQTCFSHGGRTSEAFNARFRREAGLLGEDFHSEASERKGGQMATGWNK
jgi:hypothetical protein